jgi:hypothetical protein
MQADLTVPVNDAQVRWQRFKCAVIMRDLTLGEAARYLGVSYNHLCEVIMGDRRRSAELQRTDRGRDGIGAL